MSEINLLNKYELVLTDQELVDLVRKHHAEIFHDPTSEMTLKIKFGFTKSYLAHIDSGGYMVEITDKGVDA